MLDKMLVLSCPKGQRAFFDKLIVPNLPKTRSVVIFFTLVRIRNTAMESMEKEKEVKTMMKVTVRCFKKVNKYNTETGELIAKKLVPKEERIYYGDIKRVNDTQPNDTDVDIYYTDGTMDWFTVDGYDRHTVSFESVDEDGN